MNPRLFLLKDFIDIEDNIDTVILQYENGVPTLDRYSEECIVSSSEISIELFKKILDFFNKEVPITISNEDYKTFLSEKSKIIYIRLSIPDMIFQIMDERDNITLNIGDSFSNFIRNELIKVE